MEMDPPHITKDLQVIKLARNRFESQECLFSVWRNAHGEVWDFTTVEREELCNRFSIDYNAIATWLGARTVPDPTLRHATKVLLTRAANEIDFNMVPRDNITAHSFILRSLVCRRPS